MRACVFVRVRVRTTGAAPADSRRKAEEPSIPQPPGGTALGRLQGRLGWRGVGSQGQGRLGCQAHGDTHSVGVRTAVSPLPA
eukprot:364938-Chlamydomonas_euryale.AAC.13